MSYTGNVNINSTNSDYYQYINYGATGTFYSVPHGASGTNNPNLYVASGTHSSNYINSYGPVAVNAIQYGASGASGASGTHSSNINYGLSGTGFYNGLSGASGTNNPIGPSGNTDSTTNWPTGLSGPNDSNSIYNTTSIWNNFSNIYHSYPTINHYTASLMDEVTIGNYILFPPHDKNNINYNCIHDRLSIKTDKFIFESHPVKEGRKYLLLHENKMFNTIINLNTLNDVNTKFNDMLNYINQIMDTENDISIVNYCKIIINKDYFISKKIKRKIFITI